MKKYKSQQSNGNYKSNQMKIKTLKDTIKKEKLAV